MSILKHGLLVGGVISAIAATQLPAAMAQDSALPATKPAPAGTDAATSLGITSVDAGKLVGESVYDQKSDKIGNIESVIVDPKGKVTSVVLDVGGWLESDKRISVPWTDLKSNADGKITS